MDDRCPDCKDYVDELEAEIERLEKEVERLQLARIAAENPGIDLDAVREYRKRVRSCERCESQHTPSEPCAPLQLCPVCGRNGGGVPCGHYDEAIAL